jgi:signal transduction histidine kinase
MHDGLAHRLSMVAMHAGALEFRPDAPPARVADAAGVVREGVHQALDELRDVILLLRDEGEPNRRRPLPGLVDLPALVAELAEVGVNVRLEHRAPTSRLTPATSRAAFRVVQESLTNARRHAPGSVVAISLTGQPGDRLDIVVTNPKSTPSRSPSAAAFPRHGNGTGLGLVGLRERVELAGGELVVDDGANEFRVFAWLPWPDE